MAASMVDPLALIREELECAICKDIYVDAKFLSCQHYFCLECIRQLSTGMANRASTYRLRCPLCKVSTEVIGGRPENLKSNKLANDMVVRILEIEDDRKKKLSCQGGDCSQDSQYVQKATSYCETCTVAICGTCSMRHHRDPQKHSMLPVHEAVTKERAVLRELLEWGRSTETSLQAEETAQMQTLDKCFDDVEGEMNMTFNRIRRELERKEMKMKTQLQDVKDEFLSALNSESKRSMEARRSIIRLNRMASKCLDHGSEQRLFEQCQTICKDYLCHKEALSNMPVKTESCITKLESKVVYESTQETDVQVGMIKFVREWPLQQFPLKGNGGTGKPSSVITLGEDKKIAIGFQNKPQGDVYERSGKFSHSVGHEPIKDMALLTKDTIIVLNNRGDFAAQQFNQSKCTKRVLKTHDANTAAPNSVAIDHNGNILLLYRSHLDCLSKDGSPLGTISLDLKHQPSQLRVGQSPGGETTVVLLRDGETLRLLHLDLSKKKIVEERHLPCHQPDTRRFGTLDREGHCFIANLHNKGSVTIKKYETNSFLYCEEIATDLEMEVGEDESIIMSAPDPTCLIMCTPREICVFSEKDCDESSSP